MASSQALTIDYKLAVGAHDTVKESDRLVFALKEGENPLAALSQAILQAQTAMNECLTQAKEVLGSELDKERAAEVKWKAEKAKQAQNAGGARVADEDESDEDEDGDEEP